MSSNIDQLKKEEYLSASEKHILESELNESNRRAMQTLIEAYSKSKEFKEHPILTKKLEERLTPIFLSAQKQGIKVSLNKYSLDAPSRNATLVQVKQPSKEKEK